MTDTSKLLRLGDSIVNLENVVLINLEAKADGKPRVLIEFNAPGPEHLEDGKILAHLRVAFDGDKAQALRDFFRNKVPDLLAGDLGETP